MIGLAILCTGLMLLRRERFFLAGAVLALAAYKPNLLALVILGCVVRYPRLLRGLVPALVLLGLLACVPGGWDGCRGYLTFGSQMAVSSWDVETPAWKLHSLASWLALLPHVPARFVSASLGIAISLGIAVRWRRAPDNPSVCGWALALLIVTNALFNPYTPIYDLSLLLVACLLASECLAVTARAPAQTLARHAGVAQWVLAAIYFGPHVSQRIAQGTQLQPFTFVLGGLFCWLAIQFVRATAVGPRTEATREPACWAEC